MDGALVGGAASEQSLHSPRDGRESPLPVTLEFTLSQCRLFPTSRERCASKSTRAQSLAAAHRDTNNAATVQSSLHYCAHRTRVVSYISTTRMTHNRLPMYMRVVQECLDFRGKLRKHGGWWERGRRILYFNLNQRGPALYHQPQLIR